MGTEVCDVVKTLEVCEVVEAVDGEERDRVDSLDGKDEPVGVGGSDPSANFVILMLSKPA